MTHKREEPGETARCVLILVPVPGQQMLIALSLKRKANVHNSTQRIVNLIRSCLFTHGAPICSNMESCLAAKSSFPAQLIISSSGESFSKTPQFSSRTDKSQHIPKTRTVHWKNVFLPCAAFETLTALQCQPCDCLLLQHLTHFYQTRK